MDQDSHYISRTDLALFSINATHHNLFRQVSLGYFEKQERLRSGDMLIFIGIGQLSLSNSHLITLLFIYCQTPDLGQGLEFDFTFAMEQKQ